MSLSPQAFWRLHKQWHRSPEAKAMKKRLMVRQNKRCARCGKALPSWGGVLNLTTYDGMKRGHVSDSEANLLHRKCHPKGTYTWEKLRQDQSVDVWRRFIEWVFSLPGRLLRRLFSRVQ